MQQPHWNSFDALTKNTCSHMILLIIAFVCVKLNKSCDFIVLEHKYEAFGIDKTSFTPMHALPIATQNEILSMLDAGLTAHKIIASIGCGIGTVSRLCAKYHPISLSLMVVILPSFPLPIFAMHNILSALGRLTLLLMLPKPFPLSQTSLSPPTLFVIA